MEDILKEDICCPVCTTTIRSFTLTLTSPQVGGRQAMFCKHGHGVCSPCTRRLAGTCPQCRSHTSWSRCLPLERAREALVLQGRVEVGEVVEEEVATSSMDVVTSQLQVLRAAKGQAQAALVQLNAATHSLHHSIKQEVESNNLKVRQFIVAAWELPFEAFFALVEECLGIPQDWVATHQLGPGSIEQ